MKTIYKYPVQVTDLQDIELPVGAQLLTVQTQGEDAQLWALVDNDVEEKETYRIRIYGTGHAINTNKPLNYLATFQMHGGGLVFHVFASKLN